MMYHNGEHNNMDNDTMQYVYELRSILLARGLCLVELQNIAKHTKDDVIPLYSSGVSTFMYDADILQFYYEHYIKLHYITYDDCFCINNQHISQLLASDKLEYTHVPIYIVFMCIAIACDDVREHECKCNECVEKTKKLITEHCNSVWYRFGVLDDIHVDNSLRINGLRNVDNDLIIDIVKRTNNERDYYNDNDNGNE